MHAKPTTQKHGRAQHMPPLPIPPAIILLEDIGGRAPYVSRSPSTANNRHIGQRKLFLNEMQFLARSAGTTRPAVVVYAGAAPSNKTAFVAALFPRAVFILVDPNPFEVYAPTSWDKTSPFGPSKTLPAKLIYGSQTDGLARVTIDNALKTVRAAYDTVLAGGTFADPRQRLFILNTYYTHEHSAAIGTAFADADIFFMSDIRTSIDETPYPADIDIVWNMAQQYTWTAILATRGQGVKTFSMMKWRYPHRNEEDHSMISPNRFTATDFNVARAGQYRDERGAAHEFQPIDFLADYYAGDLRYPRGETLLQPWARPESAETRLIFESTAPIVSYPPHREYEEKLFYYNSRLRAGPRVNLALSGSSLDPAEAAVLGIDNCNDCALESEIWMDYLTASSGLTREDASAPARIRKYIGLLVAATGGRPCHPANLRSQEYGRPFKPRHDFRERILGGQ